MNTEPGDGDGIKAFTVMNDRLALMIILADYLMTIGIIVAAVKIHHPLVSLLAIALVAGRQVAFLNLTHSGSHYSLFSNRKTNDRVDLLVAYPIFDAVRPYRATHLPHHRLFNHKTPDRFEYLEDRFPTSSDDGPWRRTWELILKPLLGGDGIAWLRATFEQMQENPWWTWRVVLYWIAVTAAFWWAGWLPYLLLYWILPLVWLYPVFYNWAELSDHYAVQNDVRNQQGLFYALFIKGHEMYHAVHHRYPRIPFYRVKAAAKYLKEHGETFEESRGPVSFFSILYRPVAVPAPSAHQ